MNNVLWDEIRRYLFFLHSWCKVLANIFSSGTVKVFEHFEAYLWAVFHSLAYPTSLHYSSQWPHLSCFPLALLLKLFIRISQDVSTSRSRNFLLPHHLSIRSCSWPFHFLFVFSTFYCGLKIWQTWEYQETEVVFYNAEHVTRYTSRLQKKYRFVRVQIDFCRRWIRRIVMGFSQK